MSDLKRIIWLASYPKSGNTWVRTFLARYFQPPGQVIGINELHKFTTADVRQDFFDQAAGGTFRAKRVEDWLARRPKALDLIAASKPGHHFVKSHCQIRKVKGVDLIPPRVTAAAIYILRNPLDVAPSLARHMVVDLDTAIERMLNEDTVMGSDTGIMEFLGRWDHHIQGWTGANGLARHVMRYEDILADPEGAFRGLFGFLKIPEDKAKFRETLEASSFGAMQREEAAQGFRERPAKMERFFAKGTAGGWRETLSRAQVARLRKAFLPMIKTWYPEMIDETARASEREVGQ